MSEPKTTFHAPVPRIPSSVPETSSAPSRARLIKAETSQRSGGTGQSVNAQVVLHALRRWWMLVVPASLLLTAAAVGAVYLTFEPQYEAAAFLQISEKPYIAFAPRDGGVSKADFSTQIQIIKSHWILGKVVASANVKDLPEIRRQRDPIAWLKTRVSVAQAGDSNTFEIKYASADAESSALIVNEVTRQFLTSQEAEAASRFRTIINSLGDQLGLREKDVRKLREQVEAAAQKFPGEEPEPGKEDAEPKPVGKNVLAVLQGRLIDVQVERAMLAARIKATKDEIDHAKAAAAAASSASAMAAAEPAKKSKPILSPDEIELRKDLVERELNASGEVKQLDSQLLAQRIALKKLEKRLLHGKDDPLYKRKLQEITETESSKKELKDNLRESVEKDVDLMFRTHQGDVAGPASDGAILARRQDELTRLEVELHGCEFAEENLRKEYNKQLTKTLKEGEQLSGERLNLKFRKDELAEKQAVLARISDRQIALQTELSAPMRVRWHEPANVPQLPIEELPIRNMSVAGLAAFFLPFALAVAWEVRARRISCPDDLERQLHLTVLGEIARLPSRPRTDLRAMETRIGSELRIFEESIDSLRTTLTLSENLRDMRILAITSAANHEGKTSVASQLAMSLARATGKTTLLIDGDMRSPDVHQVFGVARGPGLAEVLSNECALADAIVPTHNPHVRLLPAGRLKVSPHRLLGNGAWKSLLAQIPASYGYVIIDTPPVLAASEALVLAKDADAILVCVMRDVSRADQVRKATNLLTAAGGCPVGTVLNGVPIRSYKYYYGTYPAPHASAKS